MKAKIILLSRPILINIATYPDEEIYKTVYGFLLPKKPYSKKIIDEYISYLAAMHCWSSGEKDFYINSDIYNTNLLDENGAVHICDEFVFQIFNRCREKLNLKYSILNIDISKKKLDKKIYLENLITDENFYQELSQLMDDVCAPID